MQIYILNYLHSTLRENVGLEFISDSPLVDWDKENLNPSLKDDHIIAHFISDNRQNKKFITDDTTFLVRAKKRGIECITLPDEFKITIKDERDREIDRLKKQLNKRPILKTRILKDDNLLKKVQFNLKNPPQFNEEKIRHRLEMLYSDLLNKEKGKAHIPRNSGAGARLIFTYVNYRDQIKTLIEKEKDYFINYFTAVRNTKCKLPIT